MSAPTAFGGDMASVIVVGRQSRREHRLDEAVTVVGRDSGASLELGDLQISRRHALLIRARQGYFVKDLGSKNGVLLNQERVPTRQQAVLRNGDVLSIGRTTLIFKELEGAEDDGPPTPAAVPAQAAARPAATVQTVVARPERAPARTPAPPAAPANEGLAELVLPIGDEPTPAPIPAQRPAGAEAGSGSGPGRATPPSAPAAPAPAAPDVRARRRRERPEPRPASGVDAITLQALIERTERDRQFFRNLALVLFCLLLTTLVLLFAWALFQRNNEAAPPAPPPPQAGQAPASTTPAGFSLDERAFARSVQPVLSQRCASCHSQSGKGGKLLLASSDDPRTLSDNLAAVKAFVTPGQPEASPLLLKALAPAEGGLEHGGGAVLSANDAAWKAMRAWVMGLEPGAAARSPEARVLAPATAALGRSVALRGDQSQAGAGGELRYRWSLVEIPAGSSVRLEDDKTHTARLTPDLPGRYAVLLEVFEGERRGSATHVFEVPREERKPAGEPAPAAPAAVAPAAGASAAQRLLGRPADDADRAAQLKGAGAWATHLLQHEALYQRWWRQELEHLGLTGQHEPRGEPWDSLPARLRSKRFTVLDVFYALLMSKDWSDRYPEPERAVTVLLERLLGPDQAKDQDLVAKALRCFEGHEETILGARVRGQKGLVGAVVRSRKAAERLLERSHFRIRGQALTPAELRMAADRFTKEPASYFAQIVEWGQ
ncbi:MAG: FHA domain-containing protein [Planctomycetota bacterium]